MQIVYLSNRPKIFESTLKSVAAHMKFIDRALVMVPKVQQAQFEKIDSQLPLTIVTDESISQLDSSQLLKLNHPGRNYKLRHELAKSSLVDQDFIMSDDDSRPIENIDEAFFRNNGRHNSYYFHDLSLWLYGSGEFDISQQNTYQALKYLELPHLSYASHMPQIINKSIFGEVGDYFDRFSSRHSLCEWATYYNYAHINFPQRFNKPRIYRTLCWPESPDCWPMLQQPKAPVFENYTPSLYGSGMPFESFIVDENNSSEFHGFEKLAAWHRYRIEVLNGNANQPNVWRTTRQLIRRIFRELTTLQTVQHQSEILHTLLNADVEKPDTKEELRKEQTPVKSE